MKESTKEEKAFLQKVYQDVKAKCTMDSPPAIPSRKNQDDVGSEEARSGDQEADGDTSQTKSPKDA